MRILVLLFALIGSLGAGFVGLAGLEGVEKGQAQIDEAKAKGQPVIGEARWVTLKRAIYALIAGIPFGVIGGLLAVKRQGKLAAALLLAAYAIPVGLLASGLGLDLSDDVGKIIILFPAGLAVAGVLALFIRPGTPYKAPRKQPGLSKDDDFVG